METPHNNFSHQNKVYPKIFTMKIFSIFNNEYKKKFVYYHGVWKWKIVTCQVSFFSCLININVVIDLKVCMFLYGVCHHGIWYGGNIGYTFNVVFFFTICKKPRANILSKLLCSSKKQQKKIHNSIFQVKLSIEFSSTGIEHLDWHILHSFHQGITLVFHPWKMPIPCK